MGKCRMHVGGGGVRVRLLVAVRSPIETRHSAGSGFSPARSCVADRNWQRGVVLSVVLCGHGMSRVSEARSADTQLPSGVKPAASRAQRGMEELVRDALSGHSAKTMQLVEICMTSNR